MSDETSSEAATESPFRSTKFDSARSIAAAQATRSSAHREHLEERAKHPSRRHGGGPAHTESGGAGKNFPGWPGESERGAVEARRLPRPRRSITHEAARHRRVIRVGDLHSDTCRKRGDYRELESERQAVFLPRSLGIALALGVLRGACFANSRKAEPRPQKKPGFA